MGVTVHSITICNPTTIVTKTDVTKTFNRLIEYDSNKDQQQESTLETFM